MVGLQPAPGFIKTPYALLKKADVTRYARITARRASTSGAMSAGCVTSADCRAVWAMDGGGCAKKRGVAQFIGGNELVGQHHVQRTQFLAQRTHRRGHAA